MSRKLDKLRSVVRAQGASISENGKYDPRNPESTGLSQDTWDVNKTTSPISNYGTAFQEETEDLEWQFEVETAVTATLEGRDVANTLLDQVDCRQSVCRIDCFHTDGQRSELFFDTILPSEPFRAGVFSESTVNADGLEMTIVYIASPAEPNP